MAPGGREHGCSELASALTARRPPSRPWEQPRRGPQSGPMAHQSWADCNGRSRGGKWVGRPVSCPNPSVEAMGNVLAGMGNRGAGASDRPLQSPGGCYAVNRWRSLWSELARKARIWAADTVARLDPPGLVRPWAATYARLGSGGDAAGYGGPRIRRTRAQGARRPGKVGAELTAFSGRRRPARTLDS